MRSDGHHINTAHLTAPCGVYLLAWWGGGGAGRDGWAVGRLRGASHHQGPLSLWVLAGVSLFRVMHITVFWTTEIFPTSLMWGCPWSHQGAEQSLMCSSKWTNSPVGAGSWNPFTWGWTDHREGWGQRNALVSFLATWPRTHHHQSEGDALQWGRMVWRECWVAFIPEYLSNESQEEQRDPAEVAVGAERPQRAGGAPGHREEQLADLTSVFTVFSQWCDLW